MSFDHELALEQEHLDRAYARLDELRSGATGVAGDVLALGEGGTFGDRVDREVKLAVGLARRSALSIGDLPICFGRVDLDDGGRFHIGRLGVSDEHGDPLVVDWRAPVAEAFYRATVGDPRGVRRRRHLRVRGRRVVGLDDELLDPDATADAGLVGAGALLAAVTRARTGRMGDIVATVQAEQDQAIRSPLHGVLVVQGGPGTGKTAVALHRAAYLLYEHRFPLASQGVLVVGPNAVFLRYVADVLPGLGETGIELATTAELVRGLRANVIDPLAVVAVKGAVSMLDVLSDVVASHQQPLAEETVVPHGIHRLVVPPDATEVAVEEAQACGLPHNEARTVAERQLLRAVWARAKDARDRAVRAGVVGPEAIPDQREVLRALRREPAFRDLLDRVWPVLTPEQVAREAVARAMLPPPVSAAAWSEHDLALVDEAEQLVGQTPRPKAEKRRPALRIDDALERTLADMGLLPSCPNCGAELTWTGRGWACEVSSCASEWTNQQVLSDEAAHLLRSILESAGADFRVGDGPAPKATTFGHVVVDEAQDLTPMQWRMLRRRNPTGSMTVVGDLGQAKYPWAPSRWTDLGADVRVAELTVNYRTPEEVMELAAVALAEHDRELTPPRSVRRSGESPVFVAVPPGEELLDRARKIAVDEAHVVAPGKVLVVVPDSLSQRPPLDVLEGTIAELGVDDAKGLEFDSVIVVDPQAMSPAGRYVALTRTTRRLTLVMRAA